MAIGGWAFGSTPFKELTSNVFRMNQFVYEAIEFLREHKFNGLDVDWEYPRGADDKAAYVNLLKELRLAFEGESKSSGLPRLLLTAAVPASFEAIAAGYANDKSSSTTMAPSFFLFRHAIRTDPALSRCRNCLHTTDPSLSRGLFAFDPAPLVQRQRPHYARVLTVYGLRFRFHPRCSVILVGHTRLACP